MIWSVTKSSTFKLTHFLQLYWLILQDDCFTFCWASSAVTGQISKNDSVIIHNHFFSLCWCCCQLLMDCFQGIYGIVFKVFEAPLEKFISLINACFIHRNSPKATVCTSNMMLDFITFLFQSFFCKYAFFSPFFFSWSTKLLSTQK